MDYFDILEKIFITTMVSILVLITIGLGIFIFKFAVYKETPKTITGYETRTCTIYSDGTEDCVVNGRG